MISRRFLAQSSAGVLALGRHSRMAARPSTAAQPIMIDSHVHVFKRDPQYPFADGRGRSPKMRPVSQLQLPYARVVELYRDHLNFLSSEENGEILFNSVQRVWPFGL